MNSAFRGLLAAALLFLAVPAASSSTLAGKAWYVLPADSAHIKPESLKSLDLKFVCITIDDVPHPVYSEQILAVLAKHGARATFFVNGGRVKAFPDTLRRIAAAGHEIANHTWSHPSMPSLSSAGIAEEISSTQEIVKEVCGLTPRFYRPPFGNYDARTNKIVREQGLVTMLWSIDTRDWMKPGVSAVRSRVSADLHNGAVILMHGTNEESPRALDLILSDLEERGYITVTASEWYQLVGGRAVDFAPEKLPPGIVDKLYERHTVVKPDGETVDILVPRAGRGGFDGTILSELKVVDLEAGGGIFSNLKYVSAEDVPDGILPRQASPPAFFRPPHNALELRPRNYRYELELTDNQGPDFDPLYYPAPELVMVARAGDVGEINWERLFILYESASFDSLVILRESAADGEVALPKMPEGIRTQVVTNETKFPVFYVEVGQRLLNDYVDLVRQKRQAVSILVMPETLGDDVETMLALRRFILFRHLSGKFTYDPADDLRLRFGLPFEVELARFTGYNRIVVMSFSRTGDVYYLEVTGEDEHLEVIAGNDPSAPTYTRLKRGTTISIGTEPVYLVYRWGDAALGEHEGPG